MIRSILISNYRSLGREVRLQPARLCVLVGPNGAGKSNVLDALTFVRDAVVQGLPAAITHRGGIQSVRRKSSRGKPHNVEVEVQMQLPDDTEGSYGFVITGAGAEGYRVKSESARCGDATFERDGENWSGPDGLAPRMNGESLTLPALGGDARFKPLVEYLSHMMVYSIFPDTLRGPQKFDSTRPMKGHGENWLSVLRDLLRTDEREELLKGLLALSGDIEDIKVTSAAGYLVAQFKQRIGKKASWLDASSQSDGTLRVAGLLTSLLQQPTPPVICVEEPELTVHPGALPMIFDYLRQASEVSQVIVTTHSPVMLDVVDIDNESVFMVGRQGGETQIRAVSAHELEPVRAGLLTLGDSLIAGDLQLELPGLPA